MATSKRTIRRRRTTFAAGMTLIELLITCGIILVLLGIALPAIRYAREASRRLQCQTNLKQIGIGLAAYATTNGVFPFGVGADADKDVPTGASHLHRRYSIQTQLLPYLDADSVYEQINFSVAPFFPSLSGGPSQPTGAGPNETVAQTAIDLFLCPSDSDGMASIAWAKNNYRSCNGSSWAGREGDGLFSQISSVREGDVLDGLTRTAAFSERRRGDGDDQQVDFSSDVFGINAPFSEEQFVNWCTQLTEAKAATLALHHSDSGRTWMEGNMNWTRYNHYFTPGAHSCKLDISWRGIAESASSVHGGGVNVLFGDGRVELIGDDVDLQIWRALGTRDRGELHTNAEF